MTVFLAMVVSRKSLPLQPDIHSLLQRLTAALAPFSGRSCALGLSGGLDSVVLLDLLAQVAPQLSLQLSAVHVNHQLSRFAGQWQQFCLELTQQYAIPLQISQVTLQRQGGESLEAVARDARYQAYAELNTDVVLLAHHLDDQCETLMLRLLRGAGVHGLTGMPQQRSLANSAATLLRPLLGATRAEIQCYAELRGLRWINDDSNDDVRFRRNWLRHQLLPQIETIFPAYRQQLSQTRQHLNDAAQLLDEMAAADFVGDLTDVRIDLSPVSLLNEARQRNLLRWFLRQMGLTVSTLQLEQLRQQMLFAANDAEPMLQIGDWNAERYRGAMYLYRRQPFDVPQVLTLSWQGEAAIAIPEWGGRLLFRSGYGLQAVSAARLRSMPIQLRSRQGGERLRPAARAANSQLKHLLQEAGMPPWRRRLLPLIWQKECLIAVPGLAVAAEFQALDAADGVEIIWEPSQA